MIQRRRFGDTGVFVSTVCFGSMRLLPERLEPDAALELLLQLVDRGVDTFHTSREYPAHPYFCASLARLRRARPDLRPVHVVKIGVPHFDEERFDGRRLESIIDAQLRALGAERLDIVQWLVRHTPNTDEHRLPILEDCTDELARTWERLTRAGKVGVLTSFPYSDAFMRRALSVPPVKGLVTYLNLLELETLGVLDTMRASGQGLIAIRPLAVGRLIDHTPDTDAMAVAERCGIPGDGLTAAACRFPLLHPTTASIMVSVSSLAHAAQVLDAVEGVSVDLERFRALVRVAALS